MITFLGAALLVGSVLAVDVAVGQPAAAAGDVQQLPPTTDDAATVLAADVAAGQPAAAAGEVEQVLPTTEDATTVLAADVAAGQSVPASGAVEQAPPTIDDPAGAPTIEADGNTVLGSSPDIRLRSLDRQYIVAVEDAAALADVRGDLAASGVQATNILEGATTGLTAELDDEEVAALQAHDGVFAVEADQRFTLSATQTNPPWNLDRIDQRTLPLDRTYNFAETGLGVTAYVIDSGIRPTHVEFGGRINRGVYWDFGDGTRIIDCNGHGTHVAGTVGGSTWGVAKSVTIVPVKLLSCEGTTSGSIFLEGVNWIIADHPFGAPAVANVSLGGPPSTIVDNAINQMIADGITVVIAAGNETQDTCNVTPARVPAAITVAASTSTDSRAEFSNYGRCNDIFAPGVGIPSASFQSDVGSLINAGTSMSAPHVTGAAALVLQRSPSATPAQVWKAISDDATRGVLSVCCGDPNVLLHVGSPPPPPVLPSGDGPGVASAQPGQLSVFARGMDDAVWVRQYNGSTWDGWRSLGGIATSVPAVASRGAGRLEMFARGADNSLWTRSFDSTSWSGWSSLGGTLSTGPAAVSRTPGTLDVFAGGADGAVWQRSYDGSTWSGWRSLGGFVTATPAAASAGPGTIALFARGGDNALWTRTFDDSVWTGWGSLGGVLTSAPSAASRDARTYEVFARGGDNALWTRTLATGWSSLGGVLLSPATVASAATGTLDVFARGTDTALWGNHDSGGAFTGWYTLGGLLR